MTIRNTLIILTLVLVAISANGCSAEDSNVNEELIKQSNALQEIDQSWRCSIHNSFYGISPMIIKQLARGGVPEERRTLLSSLSMTDASKMNHIKDALHLIYENENETISLGGLNPRVTPLNAHLEQSKPWMKRWTEIQLSRAELYDIWNDLLE